MDENKLCCCCGVDGLLVGMLIVNGVVMLQCIEVDGMFLCLYVFGVGSNSVEVCSVCGDVKCVQFYDSYIGKQCLCLCVVLFWDIDGIDFDLYVILFDGQYVWYGNCVVQNGGVFDVDVMIGYGFEIYLNLVFVFGMYFVYVNYYGSGNDNSIIIMVIVNIIIDENMLFECQQMFVVLMCKVGDLMLLCSFMMKQFI